jgi:hypothetical protein
VDRIRNFTVAGNYNPFQPTPPSGLGSTIQQDQFEEAIVTDVIVNNEHADFAKDGYNVGMIKFRRTTTNAFKPEDQLDWAYPMYANVSIYPLIGEIVYVFRGLNRWYYLAKFNVSNRVTAQDLPELIPETGPGETSGQRTANYRSSAAPKKVGITGKSSLGEYFTDLEKVFRLKHFEGDMMFEGRSGHSIRFGSAWQQGKVNSTAKDKKIPWQSTEKDQQPNLLIRVGPDPEAVRTVDTTFGQVIEDINKDVTSIWLTTDQIVPIRVESINPQKHPIHQISISDYPKRFDGAGIYANTGLVIINARKRMIMDTNEGIHMTTKANITIDADRDHISWTTRDRNDRVVRDYRETVGRDITRSAMNNIVQIAGNSQTFSAQNISFLGSTVYIGSQSSRTEPLVLGATLRQALERLIEILIFEPIVLTTGEEGSPSPQNPDRIQRFIRWQQEYLSAGDQARILSLDNFTTRTNDRPRQARNIRPYQEENR